MAFLLAQFSWICCVGPADKRGPFLRPWCRNQAVAALGMSPLGGKLKGAHIPVHSPNMSVTVSGTTVRIRATTTGNLGAGHG